VRNTLAFCSWYLFFAILPLKLFSDDSLLSVESRLKLILKEKSDCVVRVKATKVASTAGKAKRILKMGSGFFVSKEGHILTTGLLPNADRIWIEHNDTYLLADALGHDPLCNLSLLKITEPFSSINYVRINDGPNKLEAGSFLVGITFALEFQISPTFGLLQSYESSFGKKLFPTKMIRSSLALGPGEVGAPVFDLNGRFVGITHAALPDLRSSFILPTKACQRIRDDLLLSGKVEYGWFGISTTRKLNDTNSFDIVISGFVKNSPSDQSNLKVGDHLVKVGNLAINSNGDLANSSFFAEPDTILEFQVIRKEKKLIIPVRVAGRSFNTQSDSSENFLKSLVSKNNEGNLNSSMKENLQDINSSD
jgi:S1-C subfamily serine protease